MKYFDRIRECIGRISKLMRHNKSGEVQPKDILDKLLREMESRKKLGIEETAFVPNVYAIYLSPSDYEEMSPLLSGIKGQLRNRIMDKISKKGYKLLSNQVAIEIREDRGLLKNQIVVESSFLREKAQPAPINSVELPLQEAKATANSQFAALSQTHTHGVRASRPIASKSAEYAPSADSPNRTHIIEDKKTRIIEAPRVKLEVLQGASQGDSISLRPGEYTFGRGSAAQILLPDPNDTISRIHFKLVVGDNHVRIKDMGSANGTKVNDIEIEEAELKKGDVIAAGQTLIKVA